MKSKPVTFISKVDLSSPKLDVRFGISRLIDGRYQIEVTFLDQMIYIEQPFTSRFEALQLIKAIKLKKNQPKE